SLADVENLHLNQEDLLTLLVEAGSTSSADRKTIAELKGKKLDLEKLLAQRFKELEELEKRLGKLTDDKTDLEKAKAELAKQYAALSVLEKNRTGERDSARKQATALALRLDDLLAKLRDAEASVKRLEKIAGEVPGLKADLAASRAKLTTEEKAA